MPQGRLQVRARRLLPSRQARAMFTMRKKAEIDSFRGRFQPFSIKNGPFGAIWSHLTARLGAFLLSALGHILVVGPVQDEDVQRLPTWPLCSWL